MCLDGYDEKADLVTIGDLIAGYRLHTPVRFISVDQYSILTHGGQTCV